MNTKTKILIILSSITFSALIGSLVIYPSIKRIQIRERLNKAFDNPSAITSTGGLDRLLVSEAFNPYTYQSSDKTTITRSQARERAQIIWDNYSSWTSSNQTAIIGAFSGLGHIHDVSKISYEFLISFEKDLLQVLKTALSDKSQYNILLGKINSLAKN